MKKPLTAISIMWLIILTNVAYGQPEPLFESPDQLQLSRELLSDLQDAMGPMDSRLIEPIQQLANHLIELNQFDEAHDMLDRAMQITRVNNGLYTPFQRPLLKKKIDNYAKRGDWDNARQSMEHLLWLYTKKSKWIDEALIDELLELSRLHLRGIVEDVPYWQGYHIRQSAEIRWIALGVAEKLWGKTNTRLSPIIYEQIRQFHLQTVALWRGGSTAYSLRELARGSGILRDRWDVSKIFYSVGIALINTLHAIYEAGEFPDLEGMAMSNLYLADWHILYDRPELARQTYQLAYYEMLSAGVDSTLVAELFSQPAVIPEVEFYTSVEAAVLDRRRNTAQAGDGNSDPYLSFNEWSTALPDLRSPIKTNEGHDNERDSNFALFSFSLAGVNKVSRWYRHHYTSTISMIEQAQLVSHLPDFSPPERDLLDKLNRLKFRPRLVDGQPQRATGMLKYRLAQGASTEPADSYP